jgi:DNA-binding SARP family transcriptional activator/Flp pilus assembly protein TadD
VDAGVGTSVEIRSPAEQSVEAVQINLLGTMTLVRDEAEVALPKSRKVRALLAFLVLAPREVTRSRLCEMLWDSPSDPRGELRWCLSRIRSVLDAPQRHRVQTRGDAIAIDLQGCRVDVLVLDRALERGIDHLELSELRELARAFTGEFLEGLHVDDSPLYSQWLGAERRRLRNHQAAVLRALVRRLPIHSDAALTYLEQWLKADPFERAAHERLLETLVVRGRLREAEEHLAATIRLFELEGLDWISLREAWRSARARERGAEARIDVSLTASEPVQQPQVARRASICVLPFLEQISGAAARTSLGDGLADDIITRISKLRVLFVIARGTAFSLVDRNIEAEEAGRILNVDYVTSGTVTRRNGRIHVRVELIEAQRPRIVWSDEIECADDDALRGLENIGNGIVASIAEEVEAAERKRAILKPPCSLDAWEAYHRGLWHMYRFNAADNDRAEHFFRMSAQLDPTFARAHAGLSFAYFQNAFLHRPAERLTHIAQAYEAAGQSLMADDRDPAAHWAMGRALWLRGDEAESLTELATCVDLSPNFALGHYTLGFVLCQSGDPQRAIDSVVHSRKLSPFDPLLFAMLGTHALANARLGKYEEAASWALKAVARPNAHTHIVAIAAHCLVLAGRLDEAKIYANRIRSAVPEYDINHFLAAFRLAPDAQSLFRRAAVSIGFA